MDCALLVGLPGAGKTSFATRTLLHSHLRLSLDLLRTRRREERLFACCLETRTPVVIDDTNASRAERARWIAPARAAGFRITCYRFLVDVAVCAARNAARSGRQRVPDAAIRAITRRLDEPAEEEGIDRLLAVRPEQGTFVIEEAGGR